MSTYFIADLHLCEQQPQITQSFVQFCRNKARNARALYILGDFFEYWLGDDAIDATARVVQAELIKLNQSGVELFFMTGNRDFLLGPDYAKQCGMTVLEEPHVIDLYGQAVLLIHGDAQCIDDQVYQQTRAMLRNPTWQQQFLSMPIEQRIEFAQEARKKSQQHTKNSQQEIMDVNQEAIDQLFQTHNVKTIIHGHTHRPAIHQIKDQKRIVLGDWHHQTSYLAVTSTGYQLVNC
jgi:UDP-2,3-diacylglucosamine hydrolase